MNSWLIPCNPKLYDVCAAFQNFAVIDWKQSMKNVEIGDTIFIYVGAPIQAVLFKCRVVAVNKPFSTIDDSKFVISGERYQHYGRYMELQLVFRFSPEVYPLAYLKSRGLRGSIQGPRWIDVFNAES